MIKKYYNRKVNPRKFESLDLSNLNPEYSERESTVEAIIRKVEIFIDNEYAATKNVNINSGVVHDYSSKSATDSSAAIEKAIAKLFRVLDFKVDYVKTSNGTDISIAGFTKDGEDVLVVITDGELIERSINKYSLSDGEFFPQSLYALSFD